MNKHPVILKLSLIVLIACVQVYVHGGDYLAEAIPVDTLSGKDLKEQKKQEERNKLRNSRSRFALKSSYVFAFLNTEVSFELPLGNLSSILSLEDNLGLPSKGYFFTGSFLYRITPRSGIYAQYYGINRFEDSQTTKDYIFKDVSIPAGTSIHTYFNTQVISAGYVYSILTDPNAFLGFYFNIYTMFIETGVRSALGDIDSDVRFAAPLPNFGLIASFNLIKWLNLNGGVGFFSLNTNDFGGSLYNFDISLMAKPVHWLGISLSYQQFDVRIYFPSEGINTVVDYNFRGPSLGLSFIF